MAPLSREERDELLRSARHAIEVYLAAGKAPTLDTGAPALLQPCGAFVTLHKGHHLRGCIGTFDSSDPLIETVQRMAIAAATSDPRFPPVETDELPLLTLEISVLSPLARTQPEEIEVGVHGIHISKGFRRGVLLPQVATENGWDRETFLQHTCLKAGLKPTAWKDRDVMIESFSAEVFGEQPH